MSSLRDQLLQAGLVTEAQVKKAKDKPKRVSHKQKLKVKKKREKTDLEVFYQARSKVENQEKQEAKRKKQEAARIKKETNSAINKLITDNLLNDESGDIRFNFVVGTSIKYLFVTEQQQNALIEGKLAFTFLGGRRCLIPLKTAKEILVLNPHKVVIIPS